MVLWAGLTETLPVAGCTPTPLSMLTSVAAWVMVGQLWLGTREMGQSTRWDARLRRVAPRIVASSLLMAGALWAMNAWTDRIGMARLPELALLVFGGAAIYFALSYPLTRVGWRIERRLAHRFRRTSPAEPLAASPVVGP